MTAGTIDTPERWLVAARLSRMTKRDRERGDELINGIATQDQRSAEWARDEGHVIAHVTRDRGVSGSIAPWGRPELGPWLTDPGKMAMYDGIVAYDVKRLSRDYADLPEMRKWAERHGKKLFVIKERLSWPDNRDGMLWAVMGERAYQDRQDMIEATTRELGALRAAGKLTGRPPFGYVSAGEKYDHTLIPTDAGREYVPQIFQRVIDGESLATIAKWLDTEGVKPVSGAHWWARSLGTLIRNTTYVGRRVQNEIRDGVTYAHTHECEPLVDAMTFRLAGEALAGRPKRGPQVAENRAMLAESLTCPACSWTVAERKPSSPMYKIKAGNSATPSFYYRCTGSGSQRRGCSNMVPLAVVDALVSQWAANFDGPIVEERLVPGHDHAAELEDNRMKMRSLASRDLTDDEYDSELARLRAERDRLASLPSVPDRTEYVDTGETYAGEWAKLDAAGRGAWLRAKGVKVYAAKTASGTCETAFPALALGAMGAVWTDARDGVSVIVTWLGSGIDWTDDDMDIRPGWIDEE